MRGPALFEGARVALIAPSSPISENLEEKLARAISVAEHLKLEAVLFPTARASHGYLAGTDELRANDINSAFADKSIDGIWCLRGGYGAHRLLPMLDYAMIRENAKFFGGYSDITAFHIAFRQQCGFGTYHMAMPTSDKLIEGAPYTLEYAKAMLFGEEIEYKNPDGVTMHTLVSGKAEGELCGGNLSLVAASLGTPWEIDTRGKILFIEDVDEQPYSIDGMLTQLRNAGKFRDCAGILLGQYTDCAAKKPESSLALDTVFEELIKPAGKPCITNLMCGHCSPTMSLPLGARFRMDADNSTIEEIV